MPKKIELVILDFDGVVTDNRVWTDQDGREMVAAYRSDSPRINELRKKGIEVMILIVGTEYCCGGAREKMGVEDNSWGGDAG